MNEKTVKENRVTVNYRLDGALVGELESRSAATGRAKTAIVEDALALYFQKPEIERIKERVERVNSEPKAASPNEVASSLLQAAVASPSKGLKKQADDTTGPASRRLDGGRGRRGVRPVAPTEVQE